MQNFLATPQAALTRGAGRLGRWLLGVAIVAYLAGALMLAFQMAWAAAFMSGIGPGTFLVLLLLMLAALAGPLSLWLLTVRFGWPVVLPAVALLFVSGFLLAADDPLDAVFAGLAMAGFGATLTALVATGPLADLVLRLARRSRRR